MSDNRKTIRFERQTLSDIEKYAKTHSLSFSEAVHEMVNNRVHILLKLSDEEGDILAHFKENRCLTSDIDAVIHLVKIGLHEYQNKHLFEGGGH